MKARCPHCSQITEVAAADEHTCISCPFCGGTFIAHHLDSNSPSQRVEHPLTAEVLDRILAKHLQRETSEQEVILIDARVPFSVVFTLCLKVVVSLFLIGLICWILFLLVVNALIENWNY